MKFTKFGQASFAAVVSLSVAAGLSACGASNTVDYVYVTNSKNTPGQIDVYRGNVQSGVLTPIPDSPYQSGGSNPVALVTAPNFKNLYVVNDGIGGSAGSGIVQLGIGSDAKLYAQHTYQGPAGSSLSVPNAIAINSAGTFLFVTYTYIAGGSSSASPSSGAVVVYPIAKDGSLGTPVPNGALPYYPLSNPTSNVVTPVGVTSVTSSGGSLLYIADAETATTGGSKTSFGGVTAYSVGSDGTLTLIPGPQPDGTFAAGKTPSAITSTPLGRFVYVTDGSRNELLSFSVQSGGQLALLSSTPTDVFPDGVTVDPSGQFVYVANYTANNISAYSINSTSGVTPVGTYGTGTGPTCVFVEPARGSYVYTTNFLDSTVSGLHLDPNAGTLSNVQNTPFGAAGQPTCIAATPHGSNPAITSKN